MINELISVIAATYNRDDALEAVLRSLARQSDRNFELIVADDGSGPATARVIERWAGRMPTAPVHVWHEDRGFRLAEIRNRAIRASRGRYCIFLDGDCITRPDFVAAHRQLAEPGWFVAGNRLLLSRALTQRVLVDGLQPELWSIRYWIGPRLHGDINRLAPLINLRLGALRKLSPMQWKRARGSNMAFFREDLERVDGFDAAFTGWGREDSDLFIRLIRAGVRRKDGRFATGVLHLWHPEQDRSRLPDNDDRLGQILADTRIRATRGLSTLDHSS